MPRAHFWDRIRTGNPKGPLFEGNKNRNSEGPTFGMEYEPDIRRELLNSSNTKVCLSFESLKLLIQEKQKFLFSIFVQKKCQLWSCITRLEKEYEEEVIDESYRSEGEICKTTQTNRWE
jgi:hypothetical protein